MIAPDRRAQDGIDFAGHLTQRRTHEAALRHPHPHRMGGHAHRLGRLQRPAEGLLHRAHVLAHRHRAVESEFMHPGVFDIGRDGPDDNRRVRHHDRRHGPAQGAGAHAQHLPRQLLLLDPPLEPKRQATDRRAHAPAHLARHAPESRNDLFLPDDGEANHDERNRER